MSSKTEIYISVDVETDGPIPGPNSMLSLGAAAYLKDKTLLGTFSANLECLPGATGEESTMQWWKTQPEAWEACRKYPMDPKEIMVKFVDWVDSFQGYSPVFVGYPAGFDFTFVHWYNMYFAKRDPFGFSALDIKSFAMAVLKKPFRKTVKKNMPKRWFPDLSHTHKALDNALEQGLLFLNILAESKSK